MASSGKKGKKTKGKVIPLQEFFVTQTPSSAPIRKGSSWADEVENDDNYDMRPRPALPSGPRASRDIDDSVVPHHPPYIAYVSNLPYDIEEEDLRELFVDMQIESLRLPRDERDGDGGRVKGFGYVEFTDRSGLVGAISIGDPVVKARRVRIEVANENERRRGGGGSTNRDRDRGDMNRSDIMHDPERTTGNWRQGGGSGPVQDSPSSRNSNYRNNDRDRETYSEANNRPGGWRESTERPSFRDNRSNSRDDRPGFRDDKPGFRNEKIGFNRDDRSSFRDDRERFNREDRPGYREERDKFSRDERSGGFKDKEFAERRSGGGFSSRRNFEDKGRDDFRREESEKAEPRTRPKLQLAPRSIPLEPIAAPAERPSVKEDSAEKIQEKPTSQNIFGSAKPVDTAARERQIESRLQKERESKPDLRAGGDNKETETRIKKEEKSEDIMTNKPENQMTDDRRTNSKEPRPQNKVENRHSKQDKREIKDARSDEERMPKLKEQQAPNFAGSNKYAYLDCENFSD